MKALSSLLYLINICLSDHPVDKVTKETAIIKFRVPTVNRNERSLEVIYLLCGDLEDTIWIHGKEAENGEKERQQRKTNVNFQFIKKKILRNLLQSKFSM